MKTEHVESVPRYPLAWPSGWKRTPHGHRRNSMFKAGGTWIGHEAALKRLQAELDRLGAADVVLSTNLELRLDGKPRGDQRPLDPGVALYFRFRGRATVLACDGFFTVPGNIAAIAAHIESLRRIERYGVGTIEQALAGYKALPADTAAEWRIVLGFPGGSRPTIAEIDQKFKELARIHHPDRGGSDIAFSHISRARDFAVAELKE